MQTNTRRGFFWACHTFKSMQQRTRIRELVKRSIHWPVFQRLALQLVIRFRLLVKFLSDFKVGHDPRFRLHFQSCQLSSAPRWKIMRQLRVVLPDARSASHREVKLSVRSSSPLVSFCSPLGELWDCRECCPMKRGTTNPRNDDCRVSASFDWLAPKRVRYP